MALSREAWKRRGSGLWVGLWDGFGVLGNFRRQGMGILVLVWFETCSWVAVLKGERNQCGVAV